MEGEEFVSPDIRAYYRGLDDACEWNACNPKYHEIQYELTHDYVNGYSDGMGINLECHNGICPEEFRGSFYDRDR